MLRTIKHATNLRWIVFVLRKRREGRPTTTWGTASIPLLFKNFLNDDFYITLCCLLNSRLKTAQITTESTASFAVIYPTRSGRFQLVYRMWFKVLGIMKNLIKTARPHNNKSPKENYTKHSELHERTLIFLYYSRFLIYYFHYFIKLQCHFHAYFTN